MATSYLFINSTIYAFSVHPKQFFCNRKFVRKASIYKGLRDMRSCANSLFTFLQQRKTWASFDQKKASKNQTAFFKKRSRTSLVFLFFEWNAPDGNSPWLLWGAERLQAVTRLVSKTPKKTTRIRERKLFSAKSANPWKYWLWITLSNVCWGCVAPL